MLYQNFPARAAILFGLMLTIPLKKTNAQDTTPVTFGKVSIADFNLPKSNIIDSNTNAVIIANSGSVEFVGNKKNNWVSYVYKKNTRIKILNKKAFDLATVIVHLRGAGEYQDKIEDLHASTYNVENGQVSETKLSDNDIYDQQVRKSLHDKRFTMPNLKEGSIIEYSYTITSLHFYNIPDWNFQYQQYPCLYSRFKISVPDLLRFIMIRYGIDSFYSTKSDDSYSKLYMSTVNVGTNIHNHEWVMKDIPAFKYEDFINEPGKYLDKIEFNLAQVYNGEDLTSIPTNWQDASKDLLKEKSFGRAINADNASNLYNTMTKVCSVDGDAIQAAKQIYFYVRNNFTCVPDDEIYIENDLYDVNKLHKGSVAELNMLLVALLRQRGINADPVILATRSYGHVSESFPVLEKLNYVLCMIRLGSEKIFLDASDPDMGFGKIPLDCYNGPAEIIDEHYNDATNFYPSDISEPNATSVLLVNDDKGSGENGSLETAFGYYESVDLRRTFKGRDGQEKYFKNIKKEYGPDVEVSNFHVDSLTQVEVPVKVNYDIGLRNGFDGEIIYFNPVLKGAYKENPFKATERKFPIEFPYPIDETYDLTMDIPNGFNVDELPKSVQANFNGTDGIFIYQILKDAYTVQLHMKLKINKAVFAPEDYKSLRDFFAMVVKKQSEQVVFKKK